MATNESQINTNHLTQLMLLNLGSRNACMRALIAHSTDLNRAANWLIEHRNDANIDTNPFAQQTTTTTTNTAATTTHFNPYSAASHSAAAASTASTTTSTTVHSQQHMIQQVMNLGYSREEALRAYTNVSTDDRQDTNKLVEYLVKNPKKDDKKSSYSYNSSSYYPYSNQNKKKVYRPVINIDDIKVEKEEICDVAECECLEHIGIMLREYKKFLENTYKNEAGDNGECEADKDYEKNGFYAYFQTAISGDGEYTLSDVMDDFIHLITKHDVRYGEFSKVYKYILGEDAMNGKLDENIESFDLVRRIRFSHDFVNDADNEKADEFRKKYYFGFQSVKEITIQQLCDKMYCYLLHSYDIAARLQVDEYEKLDQQFGIKTSEQLHKERQQEQKANADDEKDVSSLIKEKDISYYVGNKHYMEYASLLSKHRERWFKSSTDDAKHKQYNKFYQVLKVDDLETRVDPKELKAKLAKEKRERLREKKRIEAEKKKKEQAEQKEKEKEQEKDKEAAKAEDDNKANEQEDAEEPANGDKPKDAEKPEEEAKPKESAAEQKEPEKAKEAEKEKEGGKPAVNASKASPQVLPKPVEHVDKKEFSLGVRYNYWAPDMEDLIAIPISAKEAKHETLKDELTKNAVCKISEFEYNVLSEKAQIYFDTDYCQDNIEAGVNTFGIQILAKITKEHLIAVMVYCNYDAMRDALCSTYIRQSNDESNESMAERHSHFYHVGKLLREAVSCYGEEAHRSEKKVFYHGIAFNKRIMSDEEIKALFVYPPLSTTSLMEVALNNNCNQADEEKNSLILELKGYVSKYFDCAWLSDLCYEQEKIFFGGTRALTVNKCIDFLHGYDHKLFITAMKYIPNIFRAPMSGWKINKNDDMLQETKEMIRNLIYHQLNRFGDNLKNGTYPDNFGENGIPPDSQEALQQLCASTTEVRMHYDAMYNHRAYAFLSSLFMTPTRTFTKLEIICQLFPNIETFSMMQCPLTTLTFMYLKSFISPPNEEEEKDDHKENGAESSETNIPLRCKIREIRLIDPKTAAMSIEQVIQAEEKSLAEVQWTIESPDQVSLVLRYSDTPVVIKEPTPPPSKPEVAEQSENKDDEKDKAQTNAEGAVKKKKVVKRIVKKRIVKKKSKDAASPTSPSSPSEGSKPAEAQPGASGSESQT